MVLKNQSKTSGRNGEERGGVIQSYDLKQVHVKIIYFIIILFCLLIAFISLAPFLWVILTSFKDIQEFASESSFFPKSWDLSKYIITWNDLKFYKYYINSLIYVAGSVVCAVIFNGILAYVLSKLKPRGSKFILNLVLWSLMIPGTLSMVPLFVNINRIGLNGSFIPLWLGMGANAFYVILYKQFFDTLPTALIEAAWLDGCTNLQVFTKIVLPLSMSINVVIGMFAITAAWSDFLMPYLLLRGTGLETVMVRLFQFRGSAATDVEVLRSIVFAIIPPIILFAIFQKKITTSIMQSGIKG